MMLYIKTGLWIFISAVLYADGIFNIGGIYPELLFIFAVLYSVIARTFKSRVTVAIVCGVVAGALGGKGFVFSSLSILYAALLFGIIFRGRLKKIFITVPIAVFFVTAVCEALFGVWAVGFSYETAVTTLLSAGMNMLCSLVMYPLIKLTFEERERYIF